MEVKEKKESTLIYGIIFSQIVLSTTVGVDIITIISLIHVIT